VTPNAAALVETVMLDASRRHARFPTTVSVRFEMGTVCRKGTAGFCIGDRSSRRPSSYCFVGPEFGSSCGIILFRCHTPRCPSRRSVTRTASRLVNRVEMNVRMWPLRSSQFLNLLLWIFNGCLLVNRNDRLSLSATFASGMDAGVIMSVMCRNKCFNVPSVPYLSLTLG